MSINRGVRICFALLLSVGLPAAKNVCASATSSTADIRTPPAPRAPRINGPTIYGARPGHEFLYRIPCTGARPIHFSVKGLPASLKIDSETGIISGQTPQRSGTYVVNMQAQNVVGKVSRPFRIVVGTMLGLTPQMGWNDWYTFYDRVTDADIRSAASAMISSEMADYGYQFVDIDDAWERKPGSDEPALAGPVRDAEGAILPNSRFPDMASLTTYIHSLGLKAGIYSSPGPLTCAQFAGSYAHVSVDAAQFSRWGFDLLKYDLCSYGARLKDKDVKELQRPYVEMGVLLARADRDLLLNMCQYGLGDVWRWGRSVGGNSWRTTGDLGFAMSGSLPGFYSIGFVNAELDAYAGPGGWNDPDYLILGTAGDPHATNLQPQPTRLTHDEQYSYVSMWSLMAAPLFFSGDMTKLDSFTLNVLENAEVIAIDQDSLGRQGKIVRRTAEEFVLVKPLEDGSLAIGLFNTGSSPRVISLPWSEIGLGGAVKVRDVWRQKDLGAIPDRLSIEVPVHSVMMVRAAGPRRVK